MKRVIRTWCWLLPTLLLGLWPCQGFAQGVCVGGPRDRFARRRDQRSHRHRERPGNRHAEDDAHRRRRDILIRRRAGRARRPAGRRAGVRHGGCRRSLHRDDGAVERRAPHRGQSSSPWAWWRPSWRRSCRKSSSAAACARKPLRRSRSRTAATTTWRRRCRPWCRACSSRPRPAPSTTSPPPSRDRARTRFSGWSTASASVIASTTAPRRSTRFPAHMVDRIEILEGGQGLFYGTQAVAGVDQCCDQGRSPTRRTRCVQGGGNTNEGGFLSGMARGSAAGNRFVLYGSSDDAAGYQPFPSVAVSAQHDRSQAELRRPHVRRQVRLRFLEAAALHRRVSVHQRRPSRQPAAGARRARFSPAGRPTSSTSATSTSSAPSSTSRRSDTVQFFFKGYYHRWDSHYTEVRNVIGEPGASDVVSDHEFWGYKDYGANLMAKLTPTRGVEYYAGYDFQNYSGEDAVLLIAPNTERVNAVFGQIQTTHDLMRNADADRRRPLQRAERKREPHGLERHRPLRLRQVAVRPRHGRHLVPLSGCLRAVRHRSDLLFRQSEPEAGVEHQPQCARSAGACRPARRPSISR